MSQHTLSVLVEDRPGVLARVAGLFAARGFNIHSLAVGTTEEPGLSRMTIVVELEPGQAVERELALFKVAADGDDRARVIEIAQIFRARVVDVTHRTLSVEATGTPDKLEALRELLGGFGIVELARTGLVALGRGDGGIRERAQRGPRLAAAQR